MKIRSEGAEEDWDVLAIVAALPVTVAVSAGLSAWPTTLRRSDRPALISYASSARAPSESTYSRHSTGSIPFLRLLQSLQAGTTLPRTEVPPRPSGTM